VGLIDVATIKLSPTWRDKRVGEGRISKIVGRFLILEQFTNDQLLIRQWVGSRRDSDHNPILFKFTKGGPKRSSPFKYNPKWLKDQDFVSLIKRTWIPFRKTRQSSTAIQFADNLMLIKKVATRWAIEKRNKDEKELMEMESQLKQYYEDEMVGSESEEIKEVVNILELQMRKLLESNEAEWRLGSRTLWLACGDENTNKTHHYANHRRNVNTIWRMQNGREKRQTALKI
jgi:hypothetical protein